MSLQLIKSLEARDTLTDEEKRVLKDVIGETRTVRARDDIVCQGERVTFSTLLLEGVAARYKFLPDGRRQITSFQIAGDFVDLHAFLLHTLDHSVTALSECEIATVPHERLRVITETQPHLTRLLWLDTLIDGAIHREWLVAMGRMSALGHTAHLLCEFYVRLRAVGRVREYSFQLPTTQEELADALGISAVHVNRGLQELRSSGLITWQGRIVTIENWDKLAHLGQFDQTYLSLKREPR